MTRLAGYLTNAGNNAIQHNLKQMARSYADKAITNKLGIAGFACIGKYGGGIHKLGNILLALDGQIYNKDALLPKPMRPIDTDAELLATLYLRYGFTEMLCRINGDFSIGLYDKTLDILWLARDRFGVKPLYYATTRDGFAFSSQPRGLLALPDISCELNPQFVIRYAASHYRSFDNSPEQSPYMGIKQLPAAHALSYTGHQLKLHRYWALQEKQDYEDSSEALAAQYRELLLDAVQLRFNVANRPAFSLSGGLDSSSVLCCATTLSSTKQTAFSTVYTDATFDERHDIQDVVTPKVSQWHAVEIGNEIDLLALLERMINIHDEPVATATWLSHYLMCSHVKQQGFNALFGGLGGDELNAGEYEYFPYFFADLQIAGNSAKLEKEITKWSQYHDHPIYTKNNHTAKLMIQRLADLSSPGRCLPDMPRLTRYQSALNPEYYRRFDYDLNQFSPVMQTPFPSYLKNRSYQDLTRETLPCCLRAEDRQCADADLLHYDPFLDYRLAEFMFRIPGTEKIKNGITKSLLRNAMRGILPEATRNRITKTGWNAPAHRWFSGKTLDAINDIVLSQNFREQGVYNIKEVNRLIKEHRHIIGSNAVLENHMMFLWQMINLYIWQSGLNKYRISHSNNHAIEESYH